MCDVKKFMSLSLPPELKSKGDVRMLKERLTALFCCQHYPGDPLLKTYDLARAMRDVGIPVIGGFKKPMEK